MASNQKTPFQKADLANPQILSQQEAYRFRQTPDGFDHITQGRYFGHSSQLNQHLSASDQKESAASAEDVDHKSFRKFLEMQSTVSPKPVPGAPAFEYSRQSRIDNSVRPFSTTYQQLSAGQNASQYETRSFHSRQHSQQEAN